MFPRTGGESKTPTLHENHDIEVEKHPKIYEGTEQVTPSSDDSFPDGGLRAWLIVVGTFCTTFSTFGFINAWGVFQAYYETHLLSGTSSSDIAWIGSIQYALCFFPAVIIGRLFDIGWFKIPFAIGTCTLLLGIFLAAECKQYWQFVLAQGILVGLSCGVCFGPTISVLGHWFKRRRGLALGFNAVGSSLGGTVIPIVTRQLISHVGFQWTMRILGFIIFVFMGIANVVLARRIPPKKVAGGMFNLPALKSPPFAIYCLSVTVAFLGMYTVLTFIDVSADAVGVSSDFSFYLVSIANASSGVGRLAVGAIVDKTGPINLGLPFIIVAALVTYLWPLARTQSSLIAIAVLYGISSAPYVSTFVMPAYAFGNVEDVGRRSGMIMTFAAFGALAGPPISGAINQGSGGFSQVGYYAGSMILLSAFLVFASRYLVLQGLRGKF